MQIPILAHRKVILQSLIIARPGFERRLQQQENESEKVVEKIVERCLY